MWTSNIAFSDSPLCHINTRLPHSTKWSSAGQPRLLIWNQRLILEGPKSLEARRMIFISALFTPKRGAGRVRVNVAACPVSIARTEQTLFGSRTPVDSCCFITDCASLCPLQFVSSWSTSVIWRGLPQWDPASAWLFGQSFNWKALFGLQRCFFFN